MRSVIRALAAFVQPFLTSVSISSIRCSREHVSVEGGWGGRSIEYFPPYRFFVMFRDGDEDAAVRGMADWYSSRLIQQRLFSVPKSEGGMREGSLYRSVSALHSANGIELAVDFRNARHDLVDRAIRQRVSERFDLLKSIRDDGYLSSDDPIVVTREDHLHVLTGGHHRVAALAVCGYSSVPVARSHVCIVRFVSSFSRWLSRQANT